MDQAPYDTTRSRTVLRVAGALCLVGGVVLAFIGGRGILRDIASESMDPNFGPILTLGGGGFLCVIGLALVNAGTLGAQSRYVAGETMPTVKRSAEYLSDGEGIMGVGRTVDDREAAGTQRASGPFCRACGTRNDEDARFCDGCGASMA